MKISFSSFSSSPSSSSTTTSTTSFDNSENVTTKCFSSIIRRFFGTGSLRTHPFDCVKELNKLESDHKKESKLLEEEKIQAPPAPGLVARLMGLESMPELDLVPKNANPSSIGRSRSANSYDYSSEFDVNNPKHRRVKTSWSFREMPTVLQLENDDFLILTFENVDENVELGSKTRKAKMGSGELKQGRVDGSKNRENRGEKRVPRKKKTENDDQESIKRDINKKDKEERRMSGRSCRDSMEIQDLGSVRRHKEAGEGSKLVKKKKCRPALKKVEQECNSENSSPVSVLDLDEFQIDHESSLSEEELKGRDSSSSRKLSSDILNSDYPSHRFTNITVTEIPESRSSNGEKTKSEKLDFHIEGDYKELWGEVCKLTEEDMKASNWILKEMQKMDEVEETGTDVGLEIVDQLLLEIVTELGGFPITNFPL